MKAKTKKQALKVYEERGLNALYRFLKKNNVSYKKKVEEFGLDGVATQKAKSEWLKGGEFRFHYFAIGIKSRKTGYSYNRIRGIEIQILN